MQVTARRFAFTKGYQRLQFELQVFGLPFGSVQGDGERGIHLRAVHLTGKVDLQLVVINWERERATNQQSALKMCAHAERLLTSERHGRSRLGVHLNVARLADFADVVAHRVAAALAATEAQSAVKGVAAAASVGLGRVLLVQQGVDEEVDGALVFALHGVGDG